MAVDIPVVIDIDKAFDEAAKRVDTAIKPFQQAFDDATGQLKLKIGVKEDDNGRLVDVKKTLKDILGTVTTVDNRTGRTFTSMAHSVEEWSVALADAKARLGEINAIQARGENVDTTKLNALRESITILSSAIHQREHESGLIEKTVQKQIAVANAISEGNYALIQEARTIQEITDKLSALREKLYNIDPKTKEWADTANEIRKTTAQLEKLQRQLTIKTGTPSAVGSINRISEEMRKLEAQWAAMSKRRKFDENGELKKSAQTIVNKYRELSVESVKFGKSLQETTFGINGMTGAINRQFTAWSQVKSMAGAYISALGALRFVQNVRNVTAELEMQKVALASIIQDTEKADALFSRIKAAALKSPFEIKDLVTYTKQLSAYRIETDKLFDVTMRLADISAGLGVDMNRLILAYGQVRAASVLRGQELRQFTEAGIPLVEKLAEKFTELNGVTTTTADVFDLISKRAVPFSMIAEIFEDMTNAGGTFYRMQEKQSETLKGQWMKLKDAVTIMYDEIGNTGAVRGAMEFLIKALNSMAKNWRLINNLVTIGTAGLIAHTIATKSATAAVLGKARVDAKSLAIQNAKFAGTTRLIGALFGEATATKLNRAATLAYTRAQLKAATSTNMFSVALAKLKIALLSNPYTAIAVAAAAAIAGVVALASHLGRTGITLDELNKNVEDFNRRTQQLKDVKVLAAQYDELTQKQELNAKETERLKTVTKELAKLYPGLVKGVDEYTGAVKISTSELQKLLVGEDKALRIKTESDLKRAEAEIKHYADLVKYYGKILEQGYVMTATRGGESYKSWLNQSEREKYSKWLLENITLLRQYEAKAQELRDILSGDFIGPKVPRFFGDAFRLQLSKYWALINEGKNSVKAFTEQEIEGFSSVKDAMDDTAKKYKEQRDIMKATSNALVKATGAQKTQLQGRYNDAKALTDMYAQILTDYNAWDLVQEKGGKDKTLQNQIQEITNAYKKFIELRKREGTKAALADVDTLFPDLAGWEPTYDNVIQRLERMLTLYKGNADMTKLIKQALVNVKFDELKRVMDDTLKRLADDIKRSETARDFYNDILGLTGDRDLAASMSIEIYGETGEQIKEKIQEQLRQAFVIDDAMVNADGLQLQSVKDAIESAIKSGNAKELRKFLKYVVEDERKGAAEILQNWEKAAQERMKTWVTELAKAKSYADKRVEIATKTAQRLREIDEFGPQSQKEKLRELALEKQAKDMAKLEYEAFKDTPLYTEMFENLDAVSTQTLQRMRDELVRLQGVWKDLDPTQLKEIQSRLDAIDKVAATRNPFGALAKGFKELIKAGFGKSSQLDKDAADAAERVTRARVAQAAALEAYTKAQDEYNKIVAKSGSTSPEAKAAEQRLNAARMTLDAQTRNLKVAEELAKKAEQEKADYADILRSISNGVAGLLEFNEHVQDAGEGALSIMEAFGSSAESIEMISTMLGGLNDTISGISSTAVGFSQLLSGNIISGASYIAKGIGGLFKGITNIFYAGRVKRANKEIKKQEKILISLQEAYKDLDRAIAKAFGNEYIYNYNQQLKNLQAQAAAYQKQAAAERSKGKKKDKSKIESYEQSYRDTLNEIKDMQYQMAEYFAGTDITSAAEAFADAWLEAYKEFGNTTDAIKEKMQDMVESIVKRAALAGVVQAVLKPWYDELAQIEQWDPGAVAAMINKAYELVPTITAGLGSEAAALQAAGVNLRDTVGDFKGISRDIAGASEESILALAAGINTQNFYMSYMPMINENVAAIRAALTGEAVGAQAPSLVQSNNDLVLQYMSVLPNMDANIAELLSIARKVVEPRGTNSSSHVVAVRM